nr:PREDICTED: serine/threonine-protein kinase DCLK3-like [Camelus bactrianus]
MEVQRNEDKSTTLKLADFGLAKHVVRPIFTVCGTPTYVAPEILSEKGYGLEVDMWAAGVILYILLCGFPPFRSPERDQDELFNIIQLGRFEFLAPYWDNISDAAKDLVSRLLVVDPKKRYTAHQVLQHPWIETAGKTSRVNPAKEVAPSSEGHLRSQQARAAEQTS